MNSPQPSDTGPQPEDRIELLKLAIEDGTRYSEGQDRDLCALRNRSMQLLQVIIVGASIAFGLTLNRGVHVEEWIPILLLLALVSCAGVAAYIGHPIENFDVPGDIRRATEAYESNTPYAAYLLVHAQGIEEGKDRNQKLLERRYCAFASLAYLLAGLLAAAGVCFLVTRF